MYQDLWEQTIMKKLVEDSDFSAHFIIRDFIKNAEGH